MNLFDMNFEKMTDDEIENKIQNCYACINQMNGTPYHGITDTARILLDALLAERDRRHQMITKKTIEDEYKRKNRSPYDPINLEPKKK